MTDDKPQLEAWDRQRGESNLWYARFERYRLAGPYCKLGALENVQSDVTLPVMPVDGMQEQDGRLLRGSRSLSDCASRPMRKRSGGMRGAGPTDLTVARTRSASASALSVNAPRRASRAELM